MKYLFGPVNSRRLGRSLGIDLLPFKTCSLDCVYCECCKTTNLTDKIEEYAPTDEVISELHEYLKDKPQLDSITFAGSGEPLLHSGIKKIIRFLKKNYPDYKITILTNGTLLHIRNVRRAILDADIIVPSLDAVSEDVFNRIGRPSKGITAKKTIEGLLSLRKDFRKKIVLEIFIIPGINDTMDELALIKSACERISPDLIQLNTLDRPGAEAWVKPASLEKLRKIKEYFAPLNVEMIGNRNPGISVDDKRSSNISEAIMSTLTRRPSTINDLSVSLGVSQKDILKIIKDLMNSGAIKEEKSDRGMFYKVFPKI